MRGISNLRPSPALVIALLALAGAVVGTAFAGPGQSDRAITKNKVKKIANKQIDKRLPLTGDDIADGAVSAAKLADGAVGSSKLGDGVVSSSKLGDSAVTSGKLSSGAVTAGKIGGDAVGTNEVDGTLGGADIADGSLGAADLGPVTEGSADVGSIAAQTCVNFDNLSLSGADPQDIVLVVPTGIGSATPTANFDTTGEIIFVGIPHPGEAHVKACNVSASAIDPPAQTYAAVLIEN